MIFLLVIPLTTLRLQHSSVSALSLHHAPPRRKAFCRPTPYASRSNWDLFAKGHYSQEDADIVTEQHQNNFDHIIPEINGSSLATKDEATNSLLQTVFMGIEPTPDILAIMAIYFVEGALGLARLAQTFLLKDELQLGPAELSAISGTHTCYYFSSILQYYLLAT